jgi:hypothetical protein
MHAAARRPVYAGTMSDTPGGTAVAFVRAAELAKQGDDAALARLLGAVQLIGVPPVGPGADEEGTEEWSFRTRAVSHATASMKIGIDLWLASIFPVRKARHGFFAGTIIVGRAASSDVLIDHPSISKLHARIKMVSDGSYTIADAGSTNGTWVSTRHLADKEEVALPIGTMVKLGDWQLKFSKLEQTLALLRAP